MQNPTHLHILWTTGDPVTAEKMVFMYAINALLRGWWEQVTVIIWGAPAVLASQDAAVQSLVTKALETGVRVSACRSCADQLGVTDALERLNIDVTYWGEPLTELLKKQLPLLTV